MNRIQQREVTDPIMYAMANNAADNKRVEDNLHRVVETDQTEKPEVDPEKQKQQQKKKKEEDKNKNRGPRNGRFIDFTA
jgi:hypothetical protein